MLSGEELAWGILSGLNPEDVCVRAKASFDKSSGLYILKSFLQDIFIPPKDKKMFANSPIGDFLLNKLNHYSRLSILWYLIKARDIPLSGEFKKPAGMSGGLIYLQGTHILPLDRMAERYSGDIPGFFQRGRELGGEQLSYADASLRLFPFPGVPVAILLWKGDGEFPPRSDLLFDSTCEIQLPADIIWSTAMMSLLIMLGQSGGETDVRPKS